MEEERKEMEDKEGREKKKTNSCRRKKRRKGELKPDTQELGACEETGFSGLNICQPGEADCFQSKASLMLHPLSP